MKCPLPQKSVTRPPASCTIKAAAAICYVAMGRFDAWAEAFLGKWDYSAAAEPFIRMPPTTP